MLLCAYMRCDNVDYIALSSAVSSSCSERHRSSGYLNGSRVYAPVVFICFFLCVNLNSMVASSNIAKSFAKSEIFFVFAKINC